MGRVGLKKFPFSNPFAEGLHPGFEVLRTGFGNEVSCLLEAGRGGGQEAAKIFLPPLSFFRLGVLAFSPEKFEAALGVEEDSPTISIEIPVWQWGAGALVPGKGFPCMTAFKAEPSRPGRTQREGGVVGLPNFTPASFIQGGPRIAD